MTVTLQAGSSAVAVNWLELANFARPLKRVQHLIWWYHMIPMLSLMYPYLTSQTISCHYLPAALLVLQYYTLHIPQATAEHPVFPNAGVASPSRDAVKGRSDNKNDRPNAAAGSNIFQRRVGGPSSPGLAEMARIEVVGMTASMFLGVGVGMSPKRHHSGTFLLRNCWPVCTTVALQVGCQKSQSHFCKQVSGQLIHMNPHDI